ncbi:MAG: DNA ligase [Myxococcota bacterium]
MAQDLADGESTEMKGSGSAVYTLKNTGGVYSCSCPAWRNQSVPIERRTCKHLRRLRGDDLETERVGNALPKVPATKADGPPLLLAHKWEPDVELAGWWMSEKLDGVRAYWDGKQFLSRLGNRFYAPDWFVEGFPSTPLDGELFGGRGKFQRTVGTVKRQDRSNAWKEIRFVVFDAPAHGGVFEDRLKHVATLVSDEGVPYAEPHPHVPCRDEDHLREELRRVEELGGEGLMLRRPGSKYEAGRSSTLLKVKTFHDAEAIVVGQVPGAGKHKGRLGALLVEMPDGTRFSVGSGYKDAEREDPPPIGSIITYRYQELTNAGVPRFPTFLRVRPDAEWNGEPIATPIAPKAEPAAKPPASLSEPVGPIVDNAVRLVRRDGATHHFWEIEVEAASYTIRTGAITEVKGTLESEARMADEVARWIAEKRAAGFTGPTAVPAREPASAKSRESEASKVPPAENSEPTQESNTRYFELVDDKSQKFWELTQNGTTLTVRYGRIGAKGAIRPKSFITEEEAGVEAARLIGQKTSKGYKEKPSPQGTNDG